MYDITPSLAGRMRRLIGFMIDGVLSVGLALPVMFVLGITSRIMETRDFSTHDELTLVGLYGVVFLLLQGWLLHTRGQTVGKLLLGMRIVDMKGNQVPFPKLIVLRYAVPMLINAVPLIGGLFGLLNVLFIFGKERRCLHDHIAGTQVVEV